MENDILSLQYSDDRQVLDVFLDFPGDSVRRFLGGAKKAEASRKNITSFLGSAEQRGASETNLRLIADLTAEQQARSRNEYVERFRNHPHARLDIVEKVVEPESTKYELQLCLNEGDIADGLWDARFKYRKYALLPFYGSEEEADEAAAKELCQEKKAVEDIVLAARSGAVIRLWYGSDSDSLCALYYLLYRLDKADSPVVAMELPGRVKQFNGRSRAVRSWGQIPPEEMAIPVSGARLMPVEERRRDCAQWELLSRENADIRINKNGTVKGVPATAFDEFIMECVPDKPITAIQLTEKLMCQTLKDGRDAFGT